MKVNHIFFVLFFAFTFLKSDAQTLFNKRIAGSNWTYPGNSLIKLDDGSLMIASKYAVVKTDSTGDFIWAKDYGYWNKKILKAKGNNIFVGGANWNSNRGVFLTNIDTAGNLLWTKTFDFGINDGFNDMVETSDSSILLAGRIQYYSISGLLDSAKILLINSDFNGNPLWTKSYSIANTYQAGLYAIGIYKNLFNTYDLFGSIADSDSTKGILITIDSAGNVQNSITISSGKKDLVARIFYDNNLRIIELTNLNDLSPSIRLPILLSLDSNLNVKWAKQYDYACNNIIFHPFIVGKVNGNYLVNTGDMVCEIDTTGHLLYRKGPLTAIPLTYEYLSYLKIDEYIYYTGGYDQASFFLLAGKSDSTGYSGCNLLSSTFFPCIGNANISIQPLAALVDSISASVDTSTFFYIRPPATDFVNCPYTGVADYTSAMSMFNIYPNPAERIIHIDKLNLDNNEPTKVIIQNILGENVYHTMLYYSNNTIEFNNNLPSGLYIINIKYNNIVFQYKLIIISP